MGRRKDARLSAKGKVETSNERYVRKCCVLHWSLCRMNSSHERANLSSLGSRSSLSFSSRPMLSKREEGGDDVGDDRTISLVVACFMRSCRRFEEDASRMDVSNSPWLSDRSVSCLPFRMPQRKAPCSHYDCLCGLWLVRRFDSVGGIPRHPSGALGRPSSSSWGESSSTLPLRHTFAFVPFHRTPSYGVVFPWSFPRILRTFSKHRDGVASSWTVHWSGGNVHVSSLSFPPKIHPFGASLLHP